jgi:hypothetical protein
MVRSLRLGEMAIAIGSPWNEREYQVLILDTHFIRG